jgi:hypothetical protein
MLLYFNVNVKMVSVSKGVGETADFPQLAVNGNENPGISLVG